MFSVVIILIAGKEQLNVAIHFVKYVFYSFYWTSFFSTFISSGKLFLKDNFQVQFYAKNVKSSNLCCVLGFQGSVYLGLTSYCIYHSISAAGKAKCSSLLHEVFYLSDLYTV